MSTHPKSSDGNLYDVAIIGGGPGGAALATFLAKKGRRCFIAEASKFPRYHIGESLVPHLKRLAMSKGRRFYLYRKARNMCVHFLLPAC